MVETKYCYRCHVLISDINCADWYSHMSIKYCDVCRVKVRREKEAERLRRYRARKSAERKAKIEKSDLIYQENNLLKEQIRLLTEYNEKLRFELNKNEIACSELQNGTGNPEKYKEIL